MHEEKRNSVEIEIKPMLMTLWRKKTQILAAALACGLLVLLICFFLVTPQYEASVMFYINNSTDAHDSISAGDLSASRSLVDAYVIILNTVPTLEEIVDYSGVNRTCSELKEMISASSVNETQILKAVVTGEDPMEAKQIADGIMEVLPRRVSTIAEGVSASIIEPPQLPAQPSSPNYVKNTGIGFVLGFLLMTAVIVLRYGMDTIKASQEILQK